MEKKNSFAILAFIRNFKRFKSGEAAVYLRVTIDGKRTEISTKTTVPKEKWISSKGRVKGNGEEAKTINASIIALEHRVREIYNRFWIPNPFMLPTTYRSKMNFLFAK